MLRFDFQFEVIQAWKSWMEVMGLIWINIEANLFNVLQWDFLRLLDCKENIIEGIQIYAKYGIN